LSPSILITLILVLFFVLIFNIFVVRYLKKKDDLRLEALLQRLTTDLEKLDFEINGASVHVLTVDQILSENREQT
jgi:hypothetical protein